MVISTVVFCLVAIAACSADECTSYIIISEQHRSTLSVPEGNDKLICDRALPSDWYRFTNGDMPTSCVPTFHCGTQVPIWLNGQLPTVQGSTAVLQACYNYGKGVDPTPYGGSACCHVSQQIQVKNCGSYNVYHLARTRACNMAYCAGHAQVCPIGQSNIGSPNCTELYPKMTHSPVIDQPYVDSNGIKCFSCDCKGAVKFPCHIPYPKGVPNVAFEVTWTVDGVPIRRPGTQVPVKQTLTGDDRDATLDEMYMQGHLDTELQCEVRSYYTNNNHGPRSDTLRSNSFWVGLRKYNNSVIVDEKGNEQEITIESTVPIPCNSPVLSTCSFQIEMNSTLDPNDVSTSACVYELKCDPTTHKYSTTIKVIATRDFVKDGDQQHVLAFRPLYRFNTMWYGYNVSPIQIRSKDRPHGICTALGDPHVTQIDNNRTVDIYTVGNSVLYKSKTRPFEVEITTWACGSYHPCICAVAAREGNDFIQVDMCARTKNQLVAPDVTYPSGPFTGGTTIDPDASGKAFNINFPSGASLKVTAALYDRRHHTEKNGYLNVYLKVPTDDFGNSEGICGTYDGNPKNDRLGSDGLQHPNSTDFANSWMVQPGYSLFDNPPLRSTAFDHNNVNFCQCDSTTSQGICTKSKATNPLAQNVGKKPRRHTGTFQWGQPRGHQDYPKETRMRRNLKQVTIKRKQRTAVTRSGMTEDMARKTCTDTIRESMLSTRCQSVMPAVFVNRLIHACVEDMMVSDSDMFNIGYMNAFDFQCQDTVLRDVSVYAIGSHGMRIPPADVTTHLCPNQCSRRGTCHEGTCTCQIGYTGADCSVQAGVIPVISHIRGDGLCDVRDRKCMKVQVIAEHLIPGPELKCRYKKSEIGDSGLSPYGPYIDVPASFTSFLEVECSLPESVVLTKDSPTDAFIMSVTTDGILFSSEHTFIVYDGSCQNCDTSGNCTLKGNTCLIDRACRLNGEQNSDGGYCDPQTNPYSWTRSPVVAAEINHYTSTGSGCQCGYDKVRFDCACCTNNGCQCGVAKPHICTSCNHLYSCATYPGLIVRN
ncbi:von Willebrand factor D and EGF domain-containing protein-like isoform X1 [Mizuhopecten yessoensis]|uniref:von Willebrand factor D and EGF domain-containing protein-like isoform X1 n=1 Tax=Mizuhopecten yessoensis TaxID=6573 RepID=UPI000B45B329|nr:von Willebrand factor D and EGF domain-containing protein-like isoform X1 [Mizuhopecten yessoensis]